MARVSHGRHAAGLIWLAIFSLASVAGQKSPSSGHAIEAHGEQAIMLHHYHQQRPFGQFVKMAADPAPKEKTGYLSETVPLTGHHPDMHQLEHDDSAFTMSVFGHDHQQLIFHENSSQNDNPDDTPSAPPNRPSAQSTDSSHPESAESNSNVTFHTFPSQNINDTDNRPEQREEPFAFNLRLEYSNSTTASNHELFGGGYISPEYYLMGEVQDKYSTSNDSRPTIQLKSPKDDQQVQPVWHDEEIYTDPFESTDSSAFVHFEDGAVVNRDAAADESPVFRYFQEGYGNNPAAEQNYRDFVQAVNSVPPSVPSVSPPKHSLSLSSNDNSRLNYSITGIEVQEIQEFFNLTVYKAEAAATMSPSSAETDPAAATPLLHDVSKDGEHDGDIPNDEIIGARNTLYESAQMTQFDDDMLRMEEGRAGIVAATESPLSDSFKSLRTKPPGSADSIPSECARDARSLINVTDDDQQRSSRDLSAFLHGLEGGRAGISVFPNHVEMGQDAPRPAAQPPLQLDTSSDSSSTTITESPHISDQDEELLKALHAVCEGNGAISMFPNCTIIGAVVAPPANPSDYIIDIKESSHAVSSTTNDTVSMLTEGLHDAGAMEGPAKVTGSLDANHTGVDLAIAFGCTGVSERVAPLGYTENVFDTAAEIVQCNIHTNDIVDVQKEPSTSGNVVVAPLVESADQQHDYAKADTPILVRQDDVRGNDLADGAPSEPRLGYDTPSSSDFSTFNSSTSSLLFDLDNEVQLQQQPFAVNFENLSKSKRTSTFTEDLTDFINSEDSWDESIALRELPTSANDDNVAAPIVGQDEKAPQKDSDKSQEEEQNADGGIAPLGNDAQDQYVANDYCPQSYVTRQVVFEFKPRRRRIMRYVYHHGDTHESISEGQSSDPSSALTKMTTVCPHYKDNNSQTRDDISGDL